MPTLCPFGPLLAQVAKEEEERQRLIELSRSATQAVTESAGADSYYSIKAVAVLLPQIQGGPQGPRRLMKVRKGFLEVDPPLHQPQKTSKNSTSKNIEGCAHMLQNDSKME